MIKGGIFDGDETADYLFFILKPLIVNGDHDRIVPGEVSVHIAKTHLEGFILRAVTLLIVE